MKKKLLFIPLVGMLLAGCSIDDLMFWKQKQDEQGQKEEGKDQGEELVGKEYTATIQTSGTGFAAKFLAGSHFDTSEKQTSLKGYLDSQLQYIDLIKTISCTNLHSQSWDNQTYLQFGSGSGVGGLAIESDVKIYKVSVKVLCYAKYDSYHQITNVDSWSHFYINEQDNDMTYDGETNPSVMSFENTFESGINTLNLVSQYGRVFLKEMTITWRG